MNQINSPISWSLTKRVFFRFCFLFFAVFFFFNPVSVPYTFIDGVYEFYIQPFHKLIPWIGKHVLHLSYDITTFSNGSGDTTYDYVLVLFGIVAAIVGCIIWSLLDRRRKSYNALSSWLIISIRYYIAFTLFTYGLGKIFKLQFPDPGAWALSESYGESSPMGLAWIFFGFSKGYNYFIGLAEIIPGILLLFSRTRRAGAIFALAVSCNIMAVNFCFDVCVKIFSTILVIMSLYLLLQEGKQHLNFFFYSRNAETGSWYVPDFKKKWLYRSFVALKYVLIAGVLYYNFSYCLKTIKQQDIDSKAPLYGLFNVGVFVKNKDTLAAVITDTTRWRKFIIYYPGFAAVRFMNDSAKFYRYDIDSVTKKLVMYRSRDTTKKANLVYSFTGKDSLWLHGKWLNGDSVSITLKQYDLNKYLLLNRGFHFITERPLNR